MKILTFYLLHLKNLLKKLLGLYIKFLKFSINSAIFFNMYFLLSVLPWADFNAVTGLMLLLVTAIFLSFFVLYIAVENNNIRLFLSNISGISESGLLETFTLKNSLKLGGVIIAGMALARADDYLHSLRKISDFKDYTNHMTSLNEPLDQSVIKDILAEKSVLVLLAKSLPLILG